MRWGLSLLVLGIFTAVMGIGCGDGEKEATTVRPTATIEPSPTSATTQQSTPSPTTTATQERGMKPVITPEVLPARLQDDHLLSLAISNCQSSMRKKCGPLCNQIPWSEENKSELLQAEDNLCTRTYAGIREGVSDEALTALANEFCSQAEALYAYVGTHFDLSACTQDTGELLLGLKAMGFPDNEPTPTPVPAGGRSRSDAIPLGQTAVVPPGWEVTVLGVDEDAWPEVQAENQFNDPPEEDYRMVMGTLRVTNVQTTDESTRISGGDFEFVGSRNQVYNTPDRWCGVTPNGLEAELFPQGTAEGTVCSQVGTDETGLILIASPSWDEEDQRYFALQ